MIPLSLLNLPLAYALWVWLSQWILFFTTLRLLTLFAAQRATGNAGAVVHAAFRGLFGAVMGFTALVLGSLNIQPGWIGEYFHVLTFRLVHTYGYASSIWGLTYLLSGMNVQKSVLLAALSCLLLPGIFAVWVLSDRVNGHNEAFSLAISYQMLMTPYLWPYDQILLLIPIVTLVALVTKRGKNRRRAGGDRSRPARLVLHPAPVEERQILGFEFPCFLYYNNR